MATAEEVATVGQFLNLRAAVNFASTGGVLRISADGFGALVIDNGSDGTYSLMITGAEPFGVEIEFVYSLTTACFQLDGVTRGEVTNHLDVRSAVCRAANPLQ